jgi:hypothetical protein
MTVYFSKQTRYRNMGAEKRTRRGGAPPYYLLGGVGLILVCCICVAAFLVFEWANRGTPPVSSGPARTPTSVAKNSTSAQPKSVSDSGLELRILGMERPLQVEGGPDIPPNYEFILVTVQLRNTKSSGAAAKVNPSDFKVTGDGGLTYDANPKNITIQGIMTAQDAVAPGSTLERELIYLIARDDSGLKLNWKGATGTQVLLLE